MLRASVAGPTIAIICRDPASTDSSLLSHLPTKHRGVIRKNPRINPDHNLDRNSADDGTGASGATDIRPRDDSSGIGRHHSNRA
jgi:hypothetical protein